MTALFAGDSGTGKTMAAEVIAGDLGLDLYTVNLATVVDKYIGETTRFVVEKASCKVILTAPPAGDGDGDGDVREGVKP